jgi:4-hydroxyphenylpyruvate dioxygenase-like putative hemolysin
VLRFRQAVLAARDLDTAVNELRAALPLGEPYSDPGVGLFGLENAVMPLGDTFVEVVSPTQENTAAGRFLDKHGDGAYMAMFQIDDLAGARERAKELGIREVWSIELDDITACHLHPADIGAAIVSLDKPDPPESWRWAGPWQPHGEAKTTGLTLKATDPQAMAVRWRTVLGHLEFDDGRLEVQQGDEDGIAAFHVSGLPEQQIDVAGATFITAP